MIQETWESIVKGHELMATHRVNIQETRDNETRDNRQCDKRQETWNIR